MWYMSTYPVLSTLIDNHIKIYTSSESTRLGTAITASFCFLSTLVTVCAGMATRENRQKLSALVGSDRFIEGW